MKLIIKVDRRDLVYCELIPLKTIYIPKDKKLLQIL